LVLKNNSESVIEIEGFFMKGFKEKHEFVFSPSSLTLRPGKKQKVDVSLSMTCSTQLLPSRDFLCCAVASARLWCPLCGIAAQSELGSLLSRDDIVLKKELGHGAYVM
jgi:hypothetical protein